MKVYKTFGGAKTAALFEQSREALLAQALKQVDERAEFRKPVYLSATVFLRDGIKINGVALDISPLGARIRINRGTPLTNNIEVSIRGEVIRQRARIAWYDTGDLGVEYINPDLSHEALVDMILKMEGCDIE